ncbi:amino acid ABC transporter permease [Treponema sp. OttesenSCG-928-L16]|nr:amino acid ABC transporter permease [Treponema sp. OttesenSCG-928-L16]
MNFSFLARYWPLYLNGARNTVQLALFSVVLGIIIGLLIALMKLSKYRIPRYFATAYIEFIRGTPLMVQLFIIAYGLPSIGLRFPNVPALSGVLGISFSDFMAGIITLGINSGAYVGEIFRAGIQAVDIGQTEAARSLGMSQTMNMRYIVIPQAIRNILPALGNEFVVVIKESSIVSIIGIADLMFRADAVRSVTYLAFEPLIVAALMYFCMTFPLSKLLAHIERRMRADAKR